MTLTPWTIARILTSPKSNASFLTSCCFLGSLPEEYEPDQVLRAAREKKGHLRPELRAARFLGKETYRPASRPTERSTNPPGGSYRAIGEPAIGAGKPSGKGACSES